MEWFLKVVRDNYANFNGRARRKEYWMFTLVYMVAYIALYIVAIILSFVSSTLGSILFGLIGLGSLAVLVPSLAVTVRRMHDVGKEWYFMLIPIYNLILTLTEGDKGPNEFGPDPKGAENQDPFAGQRTINTPSIPSNPFTPKDSPSDSGTLASSTPSETYTSTDSEAPSTTTETPSYANTFSDSEAPLSTETTSDPERPSDEDTDNTEKPSNV